MTITNMTPRIAALSPQQLTCVVRTAGLDYRPMSRGRRTSGEAECYKKLRHLLLYNQIQGGTRLAEVDWAKRLETHRAAVREALALLAHEGLVVRGDRGGFFVPLMEQRDLEEVWEARLVVEVGAIRLIGSRITTGRMTNEDLACLSQLCDTMQQMHDLEMVMGFAEVDHRFHETLVKLAGNRRLLQMYTRAALPFQISSSSDPQVQRRNREQSISEHREITRLIEQHHIADAAAMLEKHLHGIGLMLASL